MTGRDMLPTALTGPASHRRKNGPVLHRMKNGPESHRRKTEFYFLMFIDVTRRVRNFHDCDFVPIRLKPNTDSLVIHVVLRRACCFNISFPHIQCSHFQALFLSMCVDSIYLVYQTIATSFR